MNTKNKIKIIFITIFTSLLCILCFVYQNNTEDATDIYEVFIDGKSVGYLLDNEKLYDIINSKQQEIKKKYNVSKVYPPENFKIIKTSSYDVVISSPEQIYNKMADIGSFTIEGYIISYKKDDKPYVINVIDKKVFDDAINNFILAFIPEDEYINYMNDTQKEIETTGKIIENMYFEEIINYKKGYISVNDTIYEDATALTQYLLFGPNSKIEKYTVVSGDTIDSISEANKLNYKEFLVANPKYTSRDSLLTIGDNVNITLINPMLTFVYDVNEVLDTEIPYEKKVEYDSSKSSDFSEITTAGVTGITRIDEYYTVKNGQTQGGVDIVSSVKIKEKVDQITTKGGYKYSGNWTSGEYIDTGSTWGWPTNQPSVITSGYEWRWGAFHDGIDISGTGCGSPIYAVLDGEVVSSQFGGMAGTSAGYNVILKHSNGYYSVYAHMIENSMTVKVGDKIVRGQIIGKMGNTGVSYGCHCHLGIFYGAPYSGGYSINPLGVYR